jgi:hypothetical protein
MDRGRRELRLRGALRDVQVLRANQQIPCALLPDTHQSRAAGNFRRAQSGNHFHFIFNYLLQLRTVATPAGMALAL